MLTAFTRNITRITVLLPITFVWALLIPLTVMAEPETLSCQAARTQMDHTRRTLIPLKQEQQHIQQQVQQSYQGLLACQTVGAQSQKEQEHCAQLQEEGPKQFQALVESITLSYQTSQQLAHQTRQVQLACPGLAENTFPKKTAQSPVQKIARTN